MQSDPTYGFSKRIGVVQRFIVYSFVTILVSTSLLKLATVLSEHPLLGNPDYLFPIISSRQILFIATLLELLMAYAITVAAGQPRRQAVAMLLITILLLVYRIELYLFSPGYPCRCLGYPGQWMKIREATLELGMRITLGYMGLAGLVLLFCSRHKPVQSSIQGNELAENPKENVVNSTKG